VEVYSLIHASLIIYNTLGIRELLSIILCGLRILKAHWMHQDCLHELFSSTVLAKLVLHASPTWLGFCSAGETANLADSSTDANLSITATRRTQMNYLMIDELFVADQSLFKTVYLSHHTCYYIASY